MVEALKKAAQEHGGRLEMVPVGCLQDLQDDIERFQVEHELNGFQKWIVNSLYSFEIPITAYPVRSIMIIAVPHPAYAEVIFTCEGKEYKVYGLVASDMSKTEQYITEMLNDAGYYLVPAPGLPLKRLAVCSGLARYGRNNITYVSGMGSHLSYVAFFTDMPCPAHPWRYIHIAESCRRCMACVNACPTGAIRSDRFLLDNSRCLSAMNESADDFPEWLSPSAHHTIYDCLRCQMICPMNARVNQNTVSPVCFSEEETARIMKGPPYVDASPALMQKIKLLELEKWADGIPRNLMLLFGLMDKGHVPSLR